MGVGDAIRSTRERLGMTKAELCRRAGLDRTGLFRIEMRGGSPSAENLGAIADALGVSADFLLGRVDSPDEHLWGGVEETDQEAAIRELGEWLAGLPKAARASAIAAGTAGRNPSLEDEILQLDHESRGRAGTTSSRKRAGKR